MTDVPAPPTEIEEDISELTPDGGEMPEGFFLRGMREQAHFDFYDALFIGLGPKRKGLQHHSTRLFGNANIGNAFFTNTVVAGQMAWDATAMVHNWYARTNIPDGPALKALTERAVVTLHIGMRPTWQCSLYALLTRKPGMNMEHATREQEQETCFLLAKTAYEALPGEKIAGEVGEPDTLVKHPNGGFAHQISDALLIENPGTPRRSFELLDDVDKKRWYHMARMLYRTWKPKNIMCIPVRQNYSVTVDLYGGELLEHFNKLLAKLDDPNWDEQGNRIHLLTAPEGHPADHPAMWIHLEGFLLRDIQ